MSMMKSKCVAVKSAVSKGVTAYSASTPRDDSVCGNTACGGKEYQSWKGSCVDTARPPRVGSVGGNTAC